MPCPYYRTARLFYVSSSIQTIQDFITLLASSLSDSSGIQIKAES